MPGRRWLRTGGKLRGVMEIRNAAGTDIVSSTRVMIRLKRR
jgi:hypothetical protein